MSTRCIIGIADSINDEKMKAVYCQHDGYPDSVGFELLRSYDTEEKIEALLEGGAMSSLGSTVENTDYYNDGEMAYQAQVHRPKPDKFGFTTDIEYRYIYVRDEKKWYVCDLKDRIMPVQDAIDEIERRRTEMMEKRKERLEAGN